MRARGFRACENYILIKHRDTSVKCAVKRVFALISRCNNMWESIGSQIAKVISKYAALLELAVGEVHTYSYDLFSK